MSAVPAHGALLVFADDIALGVERLGGRALAVVLQRRPGAVLPGLGLVGRGEVGEAAADDDAVAHGMRLVRGAEVDDLVGLRCREGHRGGAGHRQEQERLLIDA